MGRAKGATFTCWTDAEEKILKRSFQLSINKLQKKLPARTEGSIRVKMVAMGLKRIENSKSIRIEKLFIMN